MNENIEVRKIEKAMTAFLIGLTGYYGNEAEAYDGEIVSKEVLRLRAEVIRLQNIVGQLRDQQSKVKGQNWENPHA